MGVAPSSPTLPVMSCEDLATLAEQNDKNYIAEIIRENEIDGKELGMLDDEMLEEICPKKLQRMKMKVAMEELTEHFAKLEAQGGGGEGEAAEVLACLDALELRICSGVVEAIHHEVQLFLVIASAPVLLSRACRAVVLEVDVGGGRCRSAAGRTQLLPWGHAHAQHSVVSCGKSRRMQTRGLHRARKTDLAAEVSPAVRSPRSAAAKRSRRQ